MTFEGKTIVVTGAFGALGAAVAEEAAARGASVAALDHAAAAPAGFAERLGPNGLILGGVDLSLPQAAERAMADWRRRGSGASTLSSTSPAASAGRRSPTRPMPRPGTGCSPSI